MKILGWSQTQWVSILWATDSVSMGQRLSKFPLGDRPSECPMGHTLSECPMDSRTQWVSFWTTYSLSFLWARLSEFPLGLILSEWAFCGEAPSLSLSVGQTQRTWETRPLLAQRTSWHLPASAVCDKCSTEVSPSPKGWEREPETRKQTERAVITCGAKDI